MDVAAMSIGLSQMKVANDVGAAMLGNIKDLMNQQGQDLIRLMESTQVATMERSVSPHIGGSIDIKL